MIIRINNEEIITDKPVKLIDLTDRRHYAAMVNNTIRDLNYIITKDSTIRFLDLSSPEAIRIYEATLRYVLVLAIKNLYPNAHVHIYYSISMALYIQLFNIDFQIDEAVTEKISEEIRSIIKKDIPINRMSLDTLEITKYYEDMGMEDKGEILQFRDSKSVNLYECNGYYNYMFSHMLPSTGYLSKFKLFPYYPSMMLQYPRSETKGKIPEFMLTPKYAYTLTLARKWSSIIECNNIASLNKRIMTSSVSDFINICEARHNRMLASIGDKIEKRIDSLKLIAVAGPTSSGKTTFTNRLRIELLSRGIKPIMISLDNYYNHSSYTPKDEDGKLDFEHIDALDTELFNNDMLNLILGKEVTLPIFDFKTKLRSPGPTVKLSEKSIIIIEGIHALNERMTHLIPRDQKFKIFISPQQQISIDDHNPIRITDIRLIRRAVRDNLFRNTPIDDTLDRWQSVRRGEFKWIYDYQEDADYVFNSELSYELCVLKKYALPLFSEVTREDPNYASANRIVKFLKYFVDVEDTCIPCNSLLREFIGGSCF